MTHRDVYVSDTH